MLKRPRVAIFADIINVVTMCFKTIFKVSEKVKRIRIMYENAIYIRIMYENGI